VAEFFWMGASWPTPGQFLANSRTGHKVANKYVDQQFLEHPAGPPPRPGEGGPNIH
jgi:hypothetical protein